MLFIVFSKDRAPQLDLLLSSLKEAYLEKNSLEVFVVYNSSNTRFDEGYKALQKLHPNINFIIEERKNLNQQIIQTLKISQQKFCAFLVDDIVFIRPFSTSDKPFQILSQNSQILSLSMRHHPGINYTQTIDLNAPPPKFKENLVWRYRPYFNRMKKWQMKLGIIPQGDWALKFSVDGDILSRSQTLSWFTALPKIPKVTDIEPYMNKYLSPPQPYKICYPEARLINLAMNTVDNGYKYPAGNHCVDLMNEKFLAGQRLDYSQWKNLSKNSCHIIVNPVWTS